MREATRVDLGAAGRGQGRYDPDNLFRRNHNIPPAIDDTKARRPYREVTVSDRTPRR